MADTIKDLIDSLIPIHVKDKDYEKQNKLQTRKDALAEIKRIVTEEKPDKRSVRKTKPTLGAMLAGEPYAIDQANGGFNEAIDEYHDNLMKALGE